MDAPGSRLKKPFASPFETRMVAESARIEAGHVVLPRDAPWLGEFLNELMAFPNGRHDDQVDSVSQFLSWAWRHAGRGARICLIGPEVIALEDPVLG